MSYNKNFNVNANSVANISGSIITLTGSLFGSEISGTTSQFTTVSASFISASTYIGLNLSGVGTPGGPFNSIQINNSGTFSGSSGLIFNPSTNILSGVTAQFTTITASQANVGYIDFVTGNVANPTFQTGRLYCDINTFDLQFNSIVSGTSINLGQQLVVKVKNDSLTTINKGKLVRISGGLGNNPTIATASWENDSNSANTLGMMMNTVAHNDFGYVILNGVLIGVDTNTFSAGQTIYLSSSGDYTNVKPVAPRHTVKIGEVVRVGNSSVGSVFVNIQNGLELEELHDVLVTSPSNGDLLVWNSGSSVWNNTKSLSGSYNITGNLKVAGEPTIDGDNRFLLEIIDTTNMTAEVGAGFTFGGKYNTGGSIAGFAGIKGIKENSTNDNLDTALVFMTRNNDSGSLAEKMRITSDGNVGIGITSPSSSLHVRETGSSTGTWRGRIIAGGNNAAFLMGEYDSKAWLGAHNGALNSWEDFYINPDGTKSVFIGDYGEGGAITPILSLVNLTGRAGINTTSPNAALDVNGSVIISSNLTVTGSITELSTRRIKTDIVSLNNQLTTINKLNPVSYTRLDDGRKEYGFISEEVKEIYPEFVVGEGINYPKMVSVLVSSIKELTQKLENQQKEIDLLKNSKKSTRGKK